MWTYQLYLKLENRWVWNCEIKAENNPEALRKAISCLNPEHYAVPLRLEQDDPSPAKKKPRKRSRKP